MPRPAPASWGGSRVNRAFIAFRSNATGAAGGMYEKMYHYFSYKRDEYRQHYHKRSNVKSTFSAIKRKFGDSARSRTDDAMKAEVLCKIIAHNLCVLVQEQHELGIDPAAFRPAPTETRVLPG